MRYVAAADAEAVATPAYRAYVQRFVERACDMERTVARFGLAVESPAQARDRLQREEALQARLVEAGAQVRNDGKSIVWGNISPACERCRTGVRSVSSFVSLACNRDCWFCFNSNQHDFKAYRARKKDWRAELDEFSHTLGGLDYVALTGGEPLLYPQDALEFVAHARSLNERAHVRMYTSGQGLDAQLLGQLERAGLDEIRFSVKLEDDARERARLLDAMRAAVGCIPCVMVEMPVMPNTQEAMRELIGELEACGIFGINLLELCFPLHRAEEYRRRGLRLVRTPFRVPYAYGYAGALPVAGSAEAALELMCEAAARGSRLNVHYCSLENKNTAQIYAQNHGGELDVAPYRFSQRSFFYEVVRAFDDDARTVASWLDACGCAYDADERGTMVAFDPALLEALQSYDAERAACCSGESCDEDAGVRRLSSLRLFVSQAVAERDEAGALRFVETGLHVVEPADLEGGCAL